MTYLTLYTIVTANVFCQMYLFISVKFHFYRPSLQLFRHFLYQYYTEVIFTG